MSIHVGITGIGHYAGEIVVSNDDISAIIETELKKKKLSLCGTDELTDEEKVAYLTSDDWQRQRTGIVRRRHTKESTAYLAIQAALNCLKYSLHLSQEYGFIVVANVLPSFLNAPHVAAETAKGIGILLRDKLGLKNCLVVDAGAACNSYGAALHIGYAFIKSGMFKCGLVIGADKMSACVDHSDRNFFPLMGDAGAAIELSRVTESNDSFPWQEKSFTAGIDTSGLYNIMTKVGGSAAPITQQILAGDVKNPLAPRLDKLWQDGKKVRKDVIYLLCGPAGDFSKSVIKGALDKAQLPLSAVNYIYPHQANLRINEDIEKRTIEAGFKGKFVNTISEYGNTTSAAVPMSLSMSWENGNINEGAIALLLHFGAGYTYSTILTRWTLYPLPI
ncbi:TPA: hypothetical protein DEB72_01880 [Patescibacteria group bacterium]|nr:hypothetical protein [Patescibacteria group bacterium]